MSIGPSFHVYYLIDELRGFQTSEEIANRNIRTIGFVKQNRLYSFTYNDSQKSLSVGESYISADFTRLPLNAATLVTYKPYLLYAELDIVHGEPMITAKHAVAIDKVDVQQFHLGLLEIRERASALLL